MEYRSEGQSLNLLSADVLTADCNLGLAINNDDDSAIHGALLCAKSFMLSSFHSPTKHESIIPGLYGRTLWSSHAQGQS